MSHRRKPVEFEGPVNQLKGQWEPCPSLWFWCQDNVHGDFGAHGTFLVTSQWMFLVCERKFCTNRWSTPQDSGAQTQTIGDSPGRDSRWSAGIAIAVNLAGSEIVGAITGDVIVDRWALQSRSDCSNECKLDCTSECKQWLLFSVVDVENYFPVSRLWRYTLRSGLIREVAKECKSLHLSLFHRDEEKNKSDLIKPPATDSLELALSIVLESAFFMSCHLSSTWEQKWFDPNPKTWQLWSQP